MDQRIETLLDQLCVDLGFCLSGEDQLRIASIDSWSAEAFANELIASEGLNPEYEARWRKEIMRKFIAYFGSDAYDKNRD